MIEFNSENEFQLKNRNEVSVWIGNVVKQEGFELGDVSFVFCSDDYLFQLNVEFLDHDTLTDIISFDYSLGKELHGEIYISTERVEENAAELQVGFEDELHRVIIHGMLHLCGYKDKTEVEEKRMREAEDRALASRTFV